MAASNEGGGGKGGYDVPEPTNVVEQYNQREADGSVSHVEVMSDGSYKVTPNVEPPPRERETAPPPARNEGGGGKTPPPSGHEAAPRERATSTAGNENVPRERGLAEPAPRPYPTFPPVQQGYDQTARNEREAAPPTYAPGHAPQDVPFLNQPQFNPQVQPTNYKGARDYGTSGKGYGNTAYVPPTNYAGARDYGTSGKGYGNTPTAQPTPRESGVNQNMPSSATPGYGTNVNIPGHGAAPTPAASSVGVQSSGGFNFDPKNPSDALWWNEFRLQHQGMDPITYFSQPNNWKANHAPTEAEALQWALADRYWGDALMRERGFAPTRSDWYQHYIDEQKAGRPLAPYAGMANTYRGGAGFARSGGGGGGVAPAAAPTSPAASADWWWNQYGMDAITANVFTKPA